MLSSPLGGRRPVAAGLLGVVHRDVGLDEQRLGTEAVGAVEGGAAVGAVEAGKTAEREEEDDEAGATGLRAAGL